MAEQNEAAPRRSLYMQETIQQATADGGARAATPVSPTLPQLSTFGQEFRLTCPICLQDLKQPKQTSCYHIFCADCLRPLIENAEGENIVCPVCNTSCPKEDISKALNSDTYLHAFQGHVSVYAESGNVSCSNVTHDEAVSAAYFCFECGKNFCDGCHSDHSGNDAFCDHHCLRLFKTPATMTVGINKRQDEVDDRGMTYMYKCPICRNTDICEHEEWLKDLLQDGVWKNNVCSIPEHKKGNELIAYCTVCEEPICRNCSMIEHKDHETLNIGNAMRNKSLDLEALKKTLEFQQEMFADAAKSADKAEDAFRHHIYQVEQEMIGRKGSVQTQVEEAFNIAFSLIEQTGQKQAELNKQSGEMHEEEEFLNTAIKLAENALQQGTAPVEFVRIWKGLNVILEGLRGERNKKMAQDPEVVVPQQVEEKRLVLPAPNCMNPDLHILQKVGVEGTVLRKSFVLKAQDELLLFYSILPLTQTEALVSCKTQACATSVVQYSNIIQQHYSVKLRDDGQYSIIGVPGNGIVATLYQAPEGCGGHEGKRQVLFWDQALDQSMTQHEAQGAGNKLKMFAETKLPPRGVAVTRDNHLVICMAEDPKKEAGEGSESCILLMTMRGDILHQRRMTPRGAGPSNSQYFPRYVIVNINGDICVTDEKDKSIIILNGNLKEEKIRIRNPYEKDEQNRSFLPKGICHDSFGRLIVADADNHSVIRIELDSSGVRGQPQVILKDGLDGVKDLNYPTLVAMGPGPKLWVVCRNNIQVFDYMDKE